MAEAVTFQYLVGGFALVLSGMVGTVAYLTRTWATTQSRRVSSHAERIRTIETNQAVQIEILARVEKKLDQLIAGKG